MKTFHFIRWRTVLLATVVIVLAVGWWWHGQSLRQPQDAPIRQTSDIRSTDRTDQQATQDAINALGSPDAN